MTRQNNTWKCELGGVWGGGLKYKTGLCGGRVMASHHPFTLIGNDATNQWCLTEKSAVNNWCNSPENHFWLHSVQRRVICYVRLAWLEVWCPSVGFVLRPHMQNRHLYLHWELQVTSCHSSYWQYFNMFVQLIYRLSFLRVYWMVGDIWPCTPILLDVHCYANIVNRLQSIKGFTITASFSFFINVIQAMYCGVNFEQPDSVETRPGFVYLCGLPLTLFVLVSCSQEMRLPPYKEEDSHRLFCFFLSSRAHFRDHRSFSKL